MSWSLALLCPDDRKDIVAAELWDRGATGIIEEEMPGGTTRLRAFLPHRDDAISAEFGGEWREEPERDWAAEWSAAWEPIELGDRLFLIPDWRQDPTPPGRVRIETHPGRAYGTGTSEATQLALLALERHLRPGGTVLDVGVGTGILSAAAAKLGAGLVVACDIDPEAIEVADANIHRDDIAVRLFTGSARAVRASAIDTVVANINATTISLLAGDLSRVMKPGARLIVSGFLEGDAARVRASLSSLLELDAWDRNTWVSLVFSKR